MLRSNIYEFFSVKGKQILNVKWDGGIPPEALIADVKLNMKITGNGKVTQTFGLNFTLDALLGKIVHSFNLDDDVIFFEFKMSVTDSYIKNKIFKPDDILSNFDTRCKKKLRIKNEYVLVTSISLNNRVLLKRRVINGRTVNFSKRIPKNMKNLVTISS